MYYSSFTIKNQIFAYVKDGFEFIIIQTRLFDFILFLYSYLLQLLLQSNAGLIA